MADPKINVPTLALASATLVNACSDIKSAGPASDDNLADLKQMGARVNSAADDLSKVFASFDVKSHFDKISKEGDKLEGANKPKDAQAAIDRIFTLVEVPAPPTEPANDLSTLFRNISTSLITAQKELNQSSLEYAATLDPRLPQTLYGIPSVKAEMRVGFNRLEQKGVNLFFFTNSKQKQDFAESLVSFEVVGTPPPPGPTSYGDYVVPVPRMIVVGQN